MFRFAQRPLTIMLSLSEQPAGAGAA